MSEAIRVSADKIRDDDGRTTYTPFIGSEGQVGYRCEHDNGDVAYIYLNASGGSDDGVATVLLYQDLDADEFANAVHFYNTWDGVA